MAKKDKIHVAAKNRGFGLGFGANHQITLYKDESPKTGALLTQDECNAIKAWVDTQDTKRNICEVVPASSLSNALFNRLLHSDTIELVRLAPKILTHMSAHDRAVFFAAPAYDLSPAIGKEIIKTRPHLATQGFDPKDPAPYFDKLVRPGNGAQVAANGEDIEFNGLSMEAFATLLPLLFERLDGNARVKATQSIAKALQAAGEDKAFFAPLADANINRLVITDEGKDGFCNDIINNGRTLMLRSLNGPKVKFQGDEYASSNLHFHPLQNANPKEGPVKNVEGRPDAKAEFLTYESAAHEAQCRKKARPDPNHETVGQLHTILTAKGKRALLLGADVVIGEPNEQIGEYIAFLKKKKTGALEIIDDTTNAEEVAQKAVDAKALPFNPLACYKGKFDADGLAEAPFMSLHLGGLKVNSLDEVGLKEGKSDVFYRGVRVIHSSEPVTVSSEQLEALREFQPVLKTISERSCVHPTARFQPAAGHWQDVAKATPVRSLRGLS